MAISGDERDCQSFLFHKCYTKGGTDLLRFFDFIRSGSCNSSGRSCWHHCPLPIEKRKPDNPPACGTFKNNKASSSFSSSGRGRVGRSKGRGGILMIAISCNSRVPHMQAFPPPFFGRSSTIQGQWVGLVAKAWQTTTVHNITCRRAAAVDSKGGGRGRYGGGNWYNSLPFFCHRCGLCFNLAYVELYGRNSIKENIAIFPLSQGIYPTGSKMYLKHREVSIELETVLPRYQAVISLACISLLVRVHVGTPMTAA